MYCQHLKAIIQLIKKIIGLVVKIILEERRTGSVWFWVSLFLQLLLLLLF
jgi:hypothetical protein